MTEREFISKNLNRLDYQSFLLLKAGLKPVVRIFHPGKTSPGIKNLFDDLGFYALEKRPKISFGRPDGFNKYLYLSRSKTLSRLAYESEENNDKKTHGELLGYPDCCIRAYLKNSVKKTEQQRDASPYIETLGKPSFYCNNLFVRESRIGEKMEAYGKNYKIFEETEGLFLINHVPCSFNCQKSIALGRKVLGLLKKHDLPFAKKITQTLKNAILYFDVLNWVVFKGRVVGDELRYTRVLPLRSLTPDQDMIRYQQGNGLEASEKEISVYKDKKKIASIRKKNKYNGLLIDFS